MKTGEHAQESIEYIAKKIIKKLEGMMMADNYSDGGKFISKKTGRIYDITVKCEKVR